MIDGPFTVPHAFKHGFDPVVFLVRDRVKLVRMTPRTVDRQPQKTLPHDADQVLQFILPGDGALRRVRLDVARRIPRAAYQQAGADHAIGRHRLHHIAGDLLFHEPVIRLVVVKTPDDIIAILPGIVAQVVIFKPLALRVSGDIEPMPAPSLAIVW